MEAWLKSEMGAFRFPVVPQRIGVSTGHKIDTDRLVNGEAISMYGGEELKTSSFESHFPADKFRTYLEFESFPGPYECVNTIKNMAKSKNLRYIVTGTDINLPVKIAKFTYEERDGSQDVYFTIDFIEDNPPRLKNWAPATSKGNTKSTVATNKKIFKEVRGKKEIIGKSYILQHRDTICSVAKKTTGKSDNYKKIAQNPANKNTIRLNKIKPNSKVVIK